MYIVLKHIYLYIYIYIKKVKSKMQSSVEALKEKSKNTKYKNVPIIYTSAYKNDTCVGIR